jgi:hypothetical protein
VESGINAPFENCVEDVPALMFVTHLPCGEDGRCEYMPILLAEILDIDQRIFYD